MNKENKLPPTVEELQEIFDISDMKFKSWLAKQERKEIPKINYQKLLTQISELPGVKIEQGTSQLTVSKQGKVCWINFGADKTYAFFVVRNVMGSNEQIMVLLKEYLS